MDHRPEALSLERLLRVLRQRWPLLVFCLVVVAGSAFAFSKHERKRYTASAALLFRNPGLDQQASGLQPVNNADPQRDAATNVKLVKLGDVAGRTARAVGHGLTRDQVAASVDVSAQGQTDIANVAATWTDPALAAAIANSFAQEFINIRRENDQGNVRQALALVTRQLAALAPQLRAGTQGQALADREESLRILSSLQTGNATLAQRAGVPTSPSSPKVMRNTVLGALLGLLLGLSLVLLLNRLDRRLNEPSDLEDVFQLPLLGIIPASQSLAKSVGTNGKGPDGPQVSKAESEVFHLLRARLRYFNVDRDLRSVLVTSAATGDGKTTVVQNLATAAASVGGRVLIIEADLRKPVLAQRLGLDPSFGLGDVLIARTAIAEAVQEVTITIHGHGPSSETVISVLVAGAVPPNPAELIESHAMETALGWATKHYDLVLVDTPPLLVVSDAIAVLRKVDGVVIVSRLGQNTRDRAQRLREELATLGAPVLGVVANGSKQRSLPEYQYYYAKPTADTRE